MNSVARISYRGGALVMPARSLYDRELVFEQAEFYARRDGAATLELNHKEVVVSVVHDGKIDGFVRDLRASVDEVLQARRHGAQGAYGTVE